MDLVVADDSTPNYLYINNGNGTFEDDELRQSGYAVNEAGRKVEHGYSRWATTRTTAYSTVKHYLFR